MNFKPLSLTLLLLASTLLAHADERVCDKDIPSLAPDSRFHDLGNGEVKDLKTNLIWRRCSIGQEWNGTTCTGDPTGLTWQQALKKAQALGNGYRLPNYKEIISISDPACKPAINSNIFPNMSSNAVYWTSTPHATDNTQVMLFLFDARYFEAGTGVNQQTGMQTKQQSFDQPVYALPVRSEK